MTSTSFEKLSLHFNKSEKCRSPCGIGLARQRKRKFRLRKKLFAVEREVPRRGAHTVGAGSHTLRHRHLRRLVKLDHLLEPESRLRDLRLVLIEDRKRQAQPRPNDVASVRTTLLCERRPGSDVAPCLSSLKAHARIKGLDGRCDRAQV